MKCVFLILICLIPCKSGIIFYINSDKMQWVNAFIVYTRDSIIIDISNNDDKSNRKLKILTKKKIILIWSMLNLRSVIHIVCCFSYRFRICGQNKNRQQEKKLKCNKPMWENSPIASTFWTFAISRWTECTKIMQMTIAKPQWIRFNDENVSIEPKRSNFRELFIHFLRLVFYFISFNSFLFRYKN